jgi:Mg2+/Co2+ transporter CorB
LLYIVVLVTAFLLAAVVIYVFTDPLARVTVGLLFLLPILWATDALGIADTISDLPATRIRHRQYGALRSHVRLLLEVVRRLNWLTVDLERGIRSEDDVREEMNQAHDRLKGIVEGIRDTAGQASADPEMLVEPNLPADRSQPTQETGGSADEAPGG